MSSGGEDDIMVVVLVVMALPAVVRVLRPARWPNLVEQVVYWMSAGLSVLVVRLASLDCAAIFATAFQVPSPRLAAGLIGLSGSAVLMLAAALVARIRARRQI